MSKRTIDDKYIQEHNILERKFYLPGSPRVLKPGKTEEEFTLLHGALWRRHEAELVEAGFREADV